MFEPHEYTLQPPDAQAPFSATIAAVEEGDSCQASATLLDAFLDNIAAAVNLDAIPDLSLGEDWHDDGRSKDYVEPEPEAFDAYSKHLDEVWANGDAEAAAKRAKAPRPQQGEQAPAAPIVLRGFNPADWEGRKAPPR
jgi:hypothetical protein